VEPLSRTTRHQRIRRRFTIYRRTLIALVAMTSTLQIAWMFIDSGVGATSPRVTLSQTGLHVFSVNGHPFSIRTPIHVLTFNGPQFSLSIGLAHHAIDGGLETPSSMCRGTLGCVATVNGDFFNLTPSGMPDPGDEVGGIIQNCVLLHTPQISHQQVNLDAHTVSTGLNWSSSLSVNGTSVPITAINQQLPLSYSNVFLPFTGTLLYTAPYALSIPNTTTRTIYEFTPVDPTSSPTTINTTIDLTFVAATSHPTTVATGDVDISAPSTSALSALQPGATVTLTTTSSAGCDNIGGHPILLNQGVVAPIVHADTYSVKPYARTVVGWTQSGVTVFMTVDGKDEVSGATVHQLDEVLESLGVVTAIDLDGGNSTTFYAKGRVLNKPARGDEHPVSSSLLVLVGGVAGVGTTTTTATTVNP
jgi:hypothetical protein